jgi:hypothetical protein
MVFQGINEGEKERQVAEITGTDYFRNLQRLARQLKGESPAAKND